MKSVLQNVKTGRISVEEIPLTLNRSGNVLVRNVCSLVSAGTEKSVMDFSKASYLKKARMRPDLFRKVLNRAKNEGLWQTYKVVSNLIEQPIQLGYSSAGVVVEVGDAIDDIQVGDRVACAGLFAATHSEVVSVPRNLVVRMPDGLPFEEASFVALGAIAVQAVRLAELELGESVVIYGLGVVGMLCAELALAAGCRVIGVDIDPQKVQLARDRGCEGIDPGSDLVAGVLACTHGFGADKVLLCAGTKSNEPTETVPEITRQKGVLVVVGDVSMNVPRRAYFEKEIDIRISRSYGPGRYDATYEEGGIDYPIAYVRWTENRNMESVLDLAARKRIDLNSLITHRFEIAEAEKAYEIIDGTRKEPFLGIVLRYGEDEGTDLDSVQPSVAVSNSAAANGAASGVSVGLLGAGNFAKAFLIPELCSQPQVKLRHVCTASGVSAVGVARKYGGAVATSDPEEVFGDPDTKAVVITTRHDSHANYVIRGLQAGKAVFVEKPLALRPDELEEIREVYEGLADSGKKPFLMVGFNRRFSPLAQLLQEAFRPFQEPWSMIYRINAGAVPRSEWVHDPQVGGGRIVGECCHFIDFLTFLTGQAPKDLTVTSARDSQGNIDDIVTLTLQYEDGSVGTVHYFSNGPGSMPKESIEVFRGGASAQLVNFKTLRLYGCKAKGRTRYLNQVKGFREEMQAFVKAVADGAPAPIPFAELYSATRATHLAQQALASGQRTRIE